jgi:UDP-glucose 4-epimerase
VTEQLVVVLGASGFIGRHLCRNLAKQGTIVRGVGHGLWPEAEWSAWGLSQWLEADISADSLAAIAGEEVPHAFVHCAGSGTVAYSYADPLGDYERGVVSTATLVEFVRLRYADKARVVIASSAAVYGDQGDVDLAETNTRSPISPYGFNKVAAENLCDTYSRFFGVQSSVVRLFSVYGEGLRKQLLWDAMNKLSRGESQFFGTGHELRDWIHVEDAAQLLSLAAIATQAPFDVYNGGHTKATTRDVVTGLARHCGVDIRPEFTGETHIGNPRRLTANCGHAQRELGWAPQIVLCEGLERYVRWFKSNTSER